MEKQSQTIHRTVPLSSPKGNKCFGSSPVVPLVIARSPNVQSLQNAVEYLQPDARSLFEAMIARSRAARTGLEADTGRLPGPALIAKRLPEARLISKFS